jgi:hypothetical protein
MPVARIEGKRIRARPSTSQTSRYIRLAKRAGPIRHAAEKALDEGMAELGAIHTGLVFRRRLRRFALLAALATAVAGCAGSSGTLPSVSGNEQGGKVPYAEGSMPAAMDAAKAHCSQFGKKAQMTQMSPATEGGGVVGFQCR